MNTQQFFKGALMALIAVAVTFFSQTPIDFLLMGVTAVCTILVYSGKNLVELLRSDSPSGSLSFLNLISALLVAIGTGALESVSLYLIDGAINWSVLGKVVLSVTFTYLGGTWFAGPYTTEKKRLFASKSYIRSLRKVVMILVAVMAFGTLSAQKGVAVLGHVPQKTIERGILQNGEFLFSLDAIASGPIWTFENSDVQKSWLEGYGLAAGYKHIKPDLNSDWGINIAYINKIKFGEELFDKQGIALLPNYYSLVAGPVWFFGDKYPGVMVGGMIKF